MAVTIQIPPGIEQELRRTKPRMEAGKLGLRVIGTIGLLELAANKGCIPELRDVHEQLRRTNFYISDRILNDSMARHLAHRQARRPTGYIVGPR